MSDPRESNGKRLIDNTLLTLLSRFMGAFGPPVALGILGWLAMAMVEVRDSTRDQTAKMQYKVEPDLARHEAKLQEHDGRLGRLEVSGGGVSGTTTPR